MEHKELTPHLLQNRFHTDFYATRRATFTEFYATRHAPCDFYSKVWSIRNRCPRVARLDSLYRLRNEPLARLDSLYAQGIRQCELRAWFES